MSNTGADFCSKFFICIQILEPGTGFGFYRHHKKEYNDLIGKNNLFIVRLAGCIKKRFN